MKVIIGKVKGIRNCSEKAIEVILNEMSDLDLGRLMLTEKVAIVADL